MRKVTVTFKAVANTNSRLKVIKATNSLNWVPGEVFSVEDVKRLMYSNPRIDFIFLAA